MWPGSSTPQPLTPKALAHGPWQCCLLLGSQNKSPSQLAALAGAKLRTYSLEHRLLCSRRSRLHQTEELLRVDDGHMKSPSQSCVSAGAKFNLPEAYTEEHATDILRSNASAGVNRRTHSAEAAAIPRRAQPSTGCLANPRWSLTMLAITVRDAGAVPAHPADPP
jgi:hypothetical protein